MELRSMGFSIFKKLVCVRMAMQIILPHEASWCSGVSMGLGVLESWV